MLAYQELNALVLEVVVDHGLVETSHAYETLLYLSEEALAALFCDPGDVGLGSRVLN